MGERLTCNIAIVVSVPSEASDNFARARYCALGGVHRDGAHAHGSLNRRRGECVCDAAEGMCGAHVCARGSE